jgi:hypothetical protein
VRSLLIGLLVGLLFSAPARSAPEAPTFEEVGALLDRAGLPYRISEATGNYRIILDMGGGRTHLVIISKETSQLGGMTWREIWTRAYHTDDTGLAPELANRLLRDSYRCKVGDWENLPGEQGGTDVLFCIKLNRLDSPEQLKSYILFCALQADELEKELLGTDEF